MEKAPKSVSIFAAFLTFVLLLNMATALCGRTSLTFQGVCLTEFGCDRKCQKWEGATHGTCHGILNKKCFCYFQDCSNEQMPAQPAQPTLPAQPTQPAAAVGADTP